MTAGDLVLAADIGGTHITAALIDVRLHKMVPSSLVRMPVDSNGSSDQIIKRWSQCMQAAKNNASISKIGLAMPGPCDYRQGISLMKGQNKYDSLYGLNFKQLLAGAMQTDADKIYAENDAACFLQGEVFAGSAGNNCKKVIGVTLGTGLGTAVYENGKCLNADLWSAPFQNGIAENFLSAGWILQRYAQLAGKKVEGVKEIAEEAEKDLLVLSIFKEFGRNLATFLYYFLQKESAEAVVIGGNIAKSFTLFRDELEKRFQNFPSVRIKTSLLGEQAALFGAAVAGTM